jgi:hypothetical protein
VIVSREKSDIVIDNSTENYSVFNAKYYNTKTEVTNHLSLLSDSQISGKFGKFSTEVEYRQLLKITVRLVCASMQELFFITTVILIFLALL